jgi:hypothetical protein
MDRSALSTSTFFFHLRPNTYAIAVRPFRRKRAAKWGFILVNPLFELLLSFCQNFRKLGGFAEGVELAKKRQAGPMHRGCST